MAITLPAVLPGEQEAPPVVLIEYLTELLKREVFSDRSHAPVDHPQIREFKTPVRVSQAVKPRILAPRPHGAREELVGRPECVEIDEACWHLCVSVHYQALYAFQIALTSRIARHTAACTHGQ